MPATSPLIDIDGWRLFLRGEPVGPWPKRQGDIYAIAPDGLEVAIAWEADGPPMRDLGGQLPGRCGVVQIRFPIPVMSKGDIAANFNVVLPLLKQYHDARRLGA